MHHPTDSEALVGTRNGSMGPQMFPPQFLSKSSLYLWPNAYRGCWDLRTNRCHKFQSQKRHETKLVKRPLQYTILRHTAVHQIARKNSLCGGSRFPLSLSVCGPFQYV